MNKEVTFIGIIHSPYTRPRESPSQPDGTKCTIEIYGQYAEGLKDVERFSHIHVIYWLHQSRGHTLLVNTPWDDKPHGLFATRSPHRVNPIAYAVARLVRRSGAILTVQGIDAIEGTPVIDIKPYIPDIDAKPDASDGWLSHTHFSKKQNK